MGLGVDWLPRSAVFSDNKALGVTWECLAEAGWRIRCLEYKGTKTWRPGLGRMVRVDIDIPKKYMGAALERG